MVDLWSVLFAGLRLWGAIEELNLDGFLQKVMQKNRLGPQSMFFWDPPFPISTLLK